MLALIANPARQVYVRYTYPFFGSAAPVFTAPVEVSKYGEKLLPQAFTAFEFSALPEEVQRQFSGKPLVLQVFQSDQVRSKRRASCRIICFPFTQTPLLLLLLLLLQYAKNKLLGEASVSLDVLLGAEPVATAEGHGVHTFDSYLPILTEAHKKIGEIRVLLTFESRGVLDEGEERAGTIHLHALDATLSTAAESTYPSSPAGRGAGAGGARDPSQGGPEYDVAVELEMWKLAEMERFKRQLEAKQEAVIKAIGDEWRQRDTLRDQAVATRVAEYTRLEEHLKVG
jgi:centrosomal protein CEP120